MATDHKKIKKYKLPNHIRLVTASSLFDGHDATINMLHEYGVSRIYSPDDGRIMGLQGMINDIL